jgi:mono/diheme cytochrome c family protein
MPNFRFQEAEVNNLVTFVLSFSQEAIPSSYLPAKKPASTYQPTGEFGGLARDLNCLTCHTFFGVGGTVGPDLTGEGSRVRREWATTFLADPYLIRPLLQARMPSFHLAEKDNSALVNYFRTVLVDDRVKIGRFPNGPQGAAFGKSLFTQQYGCTACHELNGAGGRIGPALDNAGQRLETDWVFAWLKDPQAIIPETQMPNFDLNDRVAEALTAYVMSLKSRKGQ